jgi:DNA replication protein DnaC
MQPFVSRNAEWDSALTKVAAKLCNPMGSLIFLCGNRGNGKTQLAEKAVEFYLDNIYEPQKHTGRPLYDRAMGFYLEVRAAFKTGATRTELAALLPYLKAGLLILDEIHVRGETDWENRLLTHMIDCRYADCRHTILISNLGRDAMVQSVGESVADRLRETGGVIECTWPSFRGVA